MRDPRFQHKTVHDHERILDEKARALVSAVSNRGELDEVLQEWWRSELEQAHPDEAAIKSAVDHLQALCVGLPSDAKALGAHAGNALFGGGDAVEARAGALLLGDSGAGVVGRAAEGAATFDKAIGLLKASWRAMNALQNALAEHHPQWPSERDLNALAACPGDLSEFLHFHLRPTVPNEALVEAEAKARMKGPVAYVWGRQHDRVCLSAKIGERCRLLARRDWRRLAALADSLPLRELRGDLWRQLNLHEDRDAITALLAQAPPVFADGRWTGKVSALEALQQSISHGEMLCSRVAEGGPLPEEFATTELPMWYRQVATVAGAREDGRLLLLFFAASLLRELLRPRCGVRQWQCEGVAFEGISRAIGNPPTAGEMKTVAELGAIEEGNRETDADDSESQGREKGSERASYLIAGAAFEGDSLGFWSWYCCLLESGDPGLYSHTRDWVHGCAYSVLGESLARLPEPVHEWRMAWDALFVVDRERARFEPLDYSSLTPSIHLIRVAMSLLRMKEAPSRMDRRAFYVELREKVRLLVSNEGPFGHLPASLVAEGLDLLPALCGSDWKAHLSRDFGLLLDDAERQIYAASALLDSLPVREIDSEFTRNGCSLAAALSSLETRRDQNEVLVLHWKRVANAGVSGYEASGKV